MARLNYLHLTIVRLNVPTTQETKLSDFFNSRSRGLILAANYDRISIAEI